MSDIHPTSCSSSAGDVCICECRGTRHGMGLAMHALHPDEHKVKFLDEHGHEHEVTPKPTNGERMKARTEAVTTSSSRARKDVRNLSDEALADELVHALGTGDDDRVAEVEKEMTERDRTLGSNDIDAWLAPGATDKPLEWTREETPEDRQIDALLAKGYDYVDAYTEVHGGNADRMRSQQAGGLVDVHAGETTERAARREYDEYVHLQYLAAETETRGHLLSANGKARHVDPVELFSGAIHIARANASEELLRWWEKHGRMNYTEFRAQVLGRASDRAAVAAGAGKSNGKDFI